MSEKFSEKKSGEQTFSLFLSDSFVEKRKFDKGNINFIAQFMIKFLHK